MIGDKSLSVAGEPGAGDLIDLAASATCAAASPAQADAFAPSLPSAGQVTTVAVPSVTSLGSAVEPEASAGPAPNAAADAAVAGQQARSIYGVTGAGEKIGIISDSFNALGGAAADMAAGYLPNVTVLGDQSGTDEGRAISELIYETAPGAQIDFDTVGTTLSSFTSAVTALQSAGCNVIVDDIGLAGEPFFQTGDILENAIESFVAAGGNYFTSAGNDGGTYYQATFNGISTVLPGTTSRVTAENFGGGNTLESFNHVYAGTLAIDLQWETPFRSVGTGGPAGQGAQDSLALYVYDSSNVLVASSTADRVGGDPIQYIAVNNLAAGTYKVAVALNGGAAPNIFRYEFVDDINDDTISDPKANTGGGTLFGHSLLADVNTVGADPVYGTPSRGTNPPVVEPYSSTGPGELLLDNNGNVLPAPVFTGKVDYTAPDGSSTSVSGFSLFYGTSAAAPIAAATAALMLQANPMLTPAEVSAALAIGADPMGGGANVGAGLIQAPEALAIADGLAGTGLVLDVSEDAYAGDAQFTVTVDGSQLGGVFTAKSAHAAGATEALTIAPTLTAGLHQVSVTFTNDAYGGPGQDRNLYVDGASYNGAAVSGATDALDNPGTDTFGVTVGTPAPAPTPTPALPPTPTPTPATGGLVIDVAEDAYLGDAQFTVSLDGQQVGGVYTATASNAAGQSQAITVANVLSDSAHQVGISFINDAYGGSPSADRNLYVTGASYNGAAIPGAAEALYGNATDTFAVTVGTAVTSSAVINVSEDAYAGDAQFTVAVDGARYGGVYTATASHAAGQSQSFAIAGIPENFAPHDIAVSFLNDAYGGSALMDRNLYVNSVQYDGRVVPGASAAMYGAGTQHFTAVAPAGF